MSLILDALNRSRQDVNTAPGLATQHPVEPITANRRQYLLWVALSIAVVLIAWLLVDRFTAPPVPAADIGAPVAELSKNFGSALSSVTTELKARAAASEQAVQSAVAESQPPAVTSPVTGQAPDSTVVAAPPVPQSAAEDEAVAQLYQNRDTLDEPVNPRSSPDASVRPAQGEAIPASTADQSGTRTEKPVDIDQILQEAREEMENASLDDHPVPFLSSLSQQIKDDVPTVYYQRHDYSSNAAISSVILNGKTMKVGDSPVPGMKVEEILPDSVVLSYHGTQFRLRALNSWVNL